MPKLIYAEVNEIFEICAEVLVPKFGYPFSDQARVQTLDRGTETGLICGTDFSSKTFRTILPDRSSLVWTKFGRHDTLMDPLPVVNYYLIGEVQNWIFPKCQLKLPNFHFCLLLFRLF